MRISKASSLSNIKPHSTFFQANLFTGNGEYIFSLELTAGRELTPSLALFYNSSNGNEISGFGCDLSIPALVTTKTF